MQIQQTFWQQKLSPKQLVVDWDKFIYLFDEWLLSTISIKLNHVQKQFIKSLIDPQSQHLVYKNSYLLFIKNYWHLPSNRTKLLKGHINLSTIQSKTPKLQFISDLKYQDNVLIRIIYLKDQQFQQNLPNSDNYNILSIQQNKSKFLNKQLLVQKIYQLRKNKVYGLDLKYNIISQKLINVDNFLTIGRSQTNDITIDDCQYMNESHIKLIKMITKKKKQKKPYYMLDQQENKNQTQTHWYIRDTSKSNRLQYQLNNDTTYIVLRQGMKIKIGLLDQYEIIIIKATQGNVSTQQIKQINNLLNSDRINYLGQIDPSIPQKFIINIPTKQIRSKDIQHWFNKGYFYQQNQQSYTKTKNNSNSNNKQQQCYFIIQLVNKITQQIKEYKFSGENIKIGRSSFNNLVIDKVTIRNVQCQIVCITGIWMVKNVANNCNSHLNNIKTSKPNEQMLDLLNDQQRKNLLIKKVKIKNLSVSLPTLNSINNMSNSNRIQLNQTCKHQFRAKNFIINITFPQQSQ